MINAHELTDIMMRIIVVCSIIHTFAPPWDADALKPYPNVVNAYRLFIYVVGYIALNARSTVYKSISVSNPDGPNASVAIVNGKNGGTQ